MACQLFDSKSQPRLLLAICQLKPWKLLLNVNRNSNIFFQASVCYWPPCYAQAAMCDWPNEIIFIIFACGHDIPCEQNISCNTAPHCMRHNRTYHAFCINLLAHVDRFVSNQYIFCVKQVVCVPGPGLITLPVQQNIWRRPVDSI